MSDQLVDVRRLLASSAHARVEIGRDGVLHVLAGPITLHLDRATCEELTTTMARAMVLLSLVQPKRPVPRLELVPESEGLNESILADRKLGAEGSPSTD